MVVMMQKRSLIELLLNQERKLMAHYQLLSNILWKQVSPLLCQNGFVPQPNVDSAIIKLTRRSTPAVTVTNEKNFSN